MSDVYEVDDVAAEIFENDLPIINATYPEFPNCIAPEDASEFVRERCE